LNNNNITGFKNKRVDELLGLYDKEFDQKKRVAIIREVDGIVANSHEYVLFWEPPYTRIAYWNKFGMPQGYFSRFGDYRDAPGLWWIDPEKDATLRKAMADNSAKLRWGGLGRQVLAGVRQEASRGRKRRLRRQQVTAYFIRRFLLIIPTFLGITVAVFVIMQFVPGGPVERRIMQIQMAATQGGLAGARGASLPEDAIEQIRAYYGFDKPIHTRYIQWLWKVLHLDLGTSYIYQDPVWDVIRSRFPVSIFLGLTGFLLSYLICIPLGVMKAVRHGSKFDVISSGLVFMGYSIPGWALGTALLVLFGGGSFWSVFPLGGFRPDNWEYLSLWGKITGQLQHMFLPVVCYMLGSFATLTILSKNSLMENLGQDYVRTAFAKGLDERA
jgi:microcin C transport system permease protein